MMAGNGVFVQAKNPDLTARVQLTECRVRGLSETEVKVHLPHGKILRGLMHTGLEWFRKTPDQERYFAIHWDGEKYQTKVPRQTGSAVALKYQYLEGMLLEFHSHGRIPAFFSDTDDQDEQRFRIYGVMGRIDQPRPEVAIRIGVYGHFQDVDWNDIFT